MSKNNRLKTQLEKLGKEIPQIMNSFFKLNTEAGKEGALTFKIKALIAVALAVGLRCEFCTRFHLPAAIEAGATRKEILEAAGVSITMAGGPALTFTAAVLLEELDRLGVN